MRSGNRSRRLQGGKLSGIWSARGGRLWSCLMRWAIFQTLTRWRTLGHLVGSGGRSGWLGHHSRRLQGGELSGHLVGSGWLWWSLDALGHHSRRLQVWRTLGHLLRSGGRSGGRLMRSGIVPDAYKVANSRGIWSARVEHKKKARNICEPF